jgi:opacity protein-like surface antigen
VHHRTTTRVVHTPTYRTVQYRHVRPYHGIFVYGPRPTYHQHYYHEAPREQGQVVVQEKHLPTRKVDRANTLAVGLRTGSYFSGYQGANTYGDFGLGATVRYRPAEAVGLELALQRHDQQYTSDNERSHTMAQASVELFAAPWSRVSPYVLAGVTYTGRNIEDDIFDRGTAEVITVESKAPLYGLHAGAGVEFAIGKSVALDLEARYVGYVNGTGDDDPSMPGAITTTAGFLVHF